MFKAIKDSKENLLFAGSVDNRLATCAAEASNPSKSSGASSEKSPTSNPDINHQSNLNYVLQGSK